MWKKGPIQCSIYFKLILKFLIFGTLFIANLSAILDGV
jgi:hypothetical protein